LTILLVFKNFWEIYYKKDTDFYPSYFTWVFLPAYSVVWVVSTVLIEKLSSQISLRKLFQGVLLGTLIISGVTNFFDEIRFSKAVILFGSVISFLIFLITRLFLQWYRHKSLKLGEVISRKIVIFCKAEKFVSIKSLIQAEPGVKVVGFMANEMANDRFFLGTQDEIANTKNVFGIDEVVFDLGDTPVQSIFKLIQMPNWSGLKFRFFHPQSLTIIGSDSKVERGSFYSVDRPPTLAMTYNRRVKRLADILLSFLFLLACPVLVWFVSNPVNLFRNIFVVLKGRKSWVGPKESKFEKYGIRDGIINPTDRRQRVNNLEENNPLNEHYYFTDYKLWLDVNLLLKNIKELGN
jgi:hypothetical protein